MKLLKSVFLSLLFVFFIGILLPQSLHIPVKGASVHDWHHNTFWYEPWGTSGVHKGIDIFGKKGTDVLSASSGVVLFAGQVSKGGKVVAILGPKWRIHYYAHLQSYAVHQGQWLKSGELMGTLGDTGNAKGKPAHVHYSILSLIPLPWLATLETQGWKKMFYLDPSKVLVE
ncbi:M23 family metallopeptidase [Pseudoalteromonas luteoviolacea]|uniref:M23 family metallopeptidase n=1 Tax=Pseudoalteromonas luteoviolacea TaxID=43657 RepID=UPI001F1B337B|nr:M23 family metallopeptidase [Pseudoalteromonas luteoviolacea]MCF6438850.1 M23 family metallopeptidase [Pseudoalteromonas luteoviolacea]